MNWWLILLLLLIIILFLITVTKLTITVNFHHATNQNKLSINVRAWFGIINITLNVPLDKIDENLQKKDIEKETESKKGGFQSFQLFFKNMKSLYPIVKQFLSHITVHKLEWKSKIGTGDAAFTGMLSGMVWSLKGSFVAFVGNYMRLVKKPELNIDPSFQIAVVETKFKCMFSFRIGYAIGAGIKIVTQLIRNRRATMKNNFTKKVEL